MTDTTDWAQLYRDHVEAVTALVTDLDDGQLARRVPASPEWTVQEVFAHLAGVAADSVAGRTESAPGPEWTARHVSERSGASVADLAAELASHQDGVAALIQGDYGPGTVFDISTHHADLHEGLGRGVLPEHFWLPVAEAMVASRAEGLPPAALAAVPPYEVFRAVFSRRSRAQMQAWESGLSPEQLDELPVFGPRDDDQPIPDFATSHH